MWAGINQYKRDGFPGHPNLFVHPGSTIVSSSGNNIKILIVNTGFQTGFSQYQLYNARLRLTKVHKYIAIKEKGIRYDTKNEIYITVKLI